MGEETYFSFLEKKGLCYFILILNREIGEDRQKEDANTDKSKLCDLTTHTVLAYWLTWSS